MSYSRQAKKILLVSFRAVAKLIIIVLQRKKQSRGNRKIEK